MLGLNVTLADYVKLSHMFPVFTDWTELYLEMKVYYN